MTKHIAQYPAYLVNLFVPTSKFPSILKMATVIPAIKNAKVVNQNLI